MAKDGEQVTDSELPLEAEVPPEEEVETEETEEEKTKREAAEEEAKKLGVPPSPGKKKGNTFQDRIDELTKNFREQERQTKEVLGKLSEKDRDIEALRKHNEDLMGVVKSTLEPPKEGGKTPEQLLKELRGARQKALAEVDYEEASKIGEQIEDLILVMARPPKKEDIKKVATEAVKAEGKQADMEKTMSSFVKRNEWFLEMTPGKDGKLVKNEKYDAAKASMAIGIEARHFNTWKGSYESLLDHVEEEVNRYFPPPAKAKLPVTKGLGGGEDGQTAKASLTDEQRRVARNLFPGDPKGEEKYAAQVALMGRK